MTKASKVGQVTFTQKSGSYMPAIMCDKGDLFQEYDGDSANPTNIAPDFATLQPTLSFMLTSSRVAEGIVVPTSVKWYFNDTLINFTTNVSTNSLGGETGHFKFIPYAAGSVNYYGLQIVKNLVKASGGAACTIKAVGTATVGNVTEDIQFVYSIPITKGVGSMKRVTIAAGDNKFFAIRDKGDSCILKAISMMGHTELSSNLTYKWYSMSNGQWQVISGQTAQTLTVTDKMIDTMGIFKVEVRQGSNLIGLDTQTVLDLSDPYDILTRPVPANETIVSGTKGTVKYTPILVKRGTDKAINPPTGAQQFLFTFMDSAGVILNVGSNTTPAASAEVTEDHCIQASGNVNWVIKTAD